MFKNYEHSKFGLLARNPVFFICTWELQVGIIYIAHLNAFLDWGYHLVHVIGQDDFFTWESIFLMYEYMYFFKYYFSRALSKLFFSISTSQFMIFTLKCNLKMLYSVPTPGLLQKMSKKCNSPEEFLGLLVFLAVFLFRKFVKNRKM